MSDTQFPSYQIPFIFESFRDEIPADEMKNLEKGYITLVGTIREAETEKRWEDALDWLDSEQGPVALQTWWPRLSLQEKRELIGDVWQGAKYPLMVVGERNWVRMFKEVGFLSDGPPPPDKDQKLFRGAPLARSGRGMSWTPVRETAELFAEGVVNQSGRQGALYSAVIPPRALLAYIGFDGNHRGECEAVVNPNMLRGRIAIDSIVGPDLQWRPADRDRLG